MAFHIFEYIHIHTYTRYFLYTVITDSVMLFKNKSCMKMKPFFFFCILSWVFFLPMTLTLCTITLTFLKTFPIYSIITEFLNRYEPIHIKNLPWVPWFVCRYLYCIMALHWTVTHRSWPDEVTFIGFWIYNRI